MEIGKTLEGGGGDEILVLTIAGDFDTTETGAFLAEISESIDAGVVRILLDLSDLRFINSTALGALITAQKRLEQYGGSLAVAKASSIVEKTFRILELDRRIPCVEAMADAMDRLRELSPETVGEGADEIQFSLPGSEEIFGERPRRGHLEEMHAEGLSLSFENLDELDPAATFPAGTAVELKFRLPLYHPSHVFVVGGEVESYELLGRGTVLLHVAFTEISEPEQEAVKQYVKDLRFLSDEG